MTTPKATLTELSSGTRRPLLGLRRRPGCLALIVFRMPLRAYRHRLGWILGHTFVFFVHVGRKSGKAHDTVAMVLRCDRATRELVICSAWGPDADWVLNLKAHSALEARIGRESFVPEHRFLDDDEALTVAVAFRQRHPWRLRLVSAILGWGDLRNDEVLRRFVRDHPFVALKQTTGGLRTADRVDPTRHRVLQCRPARRTR